MSPAENKSPSDSSLTSTERLSVLFEEYRALYGLAEFRLASLDRRAMLAWAALGAFLAGFDAVNEAARGAFSLGVPLAVFWLLRTTINHARSFEDAIRRIDIIECEVNAIANERLLRFQSSHPSRGRDIGGRTGSETILTVLATGLAMLATCGYLGVQHFSPSAEPAMAYGYAGYIALIAIFLLLQFWKLRRYRYRPAPDRVRPTKRFTGCWKRRRTRGTRPSTPDRKRP